MCSQDEGYMCLVQVWAFGVLLVEIILNGQLPYPGMSNEAVRVAVCAGDYRYYWARDWGGDWGGD